MKRFLAWLARIRWRWIAIGIAALLVLLVAAVAIFIFTFDANAYKDRIAQMVKEKLGRELAISGDLRLKLLPTMQLRLERATLNEKNSSQPFASIANVKLSLNPWPLLRSEVLLDHIEIGDFNVTLKRYADGTTNFDDLLSTSDTPSRLRFDLAGATITHGTISFEDALAKRKATLSNFKFNAGRLTENVASPIRASFLLNNDTPEVALQTDLRAELTFDLQQQHYRLRQVKINAQGSALSVKPLSIGLTANTGAALGKGTMEVKDLAATLDGQSGAQTLHGEISAQTIAAHASEVNIAATKAKFNLSEADRKIQISADIPNAKSTAQKIEVAAIKLNANLAQTGWNSDIALASALNVDLAQQRAVLPALTFTSKTLRERMTIDFNGNSAISLDLSSGQMDASMLNGDWKMMNDADKLAGKWSAPLLANIQQAEFSLQPFAGDVSGQFAGANVIGKLSIPVAGNWRDYGVKIPSLNLQSALTWPESALEANIHADFGDTSSAGQIAARGVAIKASGHNADGKWQADVASPVKLDLTKQLAELSRLIGTVQWTAADKSAKPFNLKLNGSGNADLARETAQFQLNARLEQSKFDGKFTIAGWANPNYRIDASLDQLDLDRYFPPSAKPAAKQVPQNKNTPANLDLTFLKQLNVDGQIKIGMLKGSGVTARNVRIEMESIKKSKP